MDRATVERQVNLMIRSVLQEDNFPNDADIGRMFLVHRCISEEEAMYLLGVYIGMFKLHPDFRKEDMVDAIVRGELPQYIADLHTGAMQSFYSRWFVSNLERFKTGILRRG